MKQKTVEKVIWFYKFWSAALLAVMLIVPDYRMETFHTWWLSTAILIMYLVINILYLAHLKKKISDDRLKELIQERNARLSRRAEKMGRHMEEKES